MSAAKLTRRQRVVAAAVCTLESLERRIVFGVEVPLSSPDGGCNDPGYSGDPIRYYDGVTRVEASDLSSSGMGPWGITRTWTNQRNRAGNAAVGVDSRRFGNSWQASEIAHIISHSDYHAVILSATDRRFFSESGSNWDPIYFTGDQLTGTDLTGFTFTTADGNAWTFGPMSSNGRALLQTHRDPHGNTTTVNYESAGAVTRIVNIKRSTGTESSTVTDIYSFTYVNTTPGGIEQPEDTMISSATLYRVTGDPAPTPQASDAIRRAEYEYYPDFAQSGGTWRDLKAVTIKDANDNILDRYHYRYWTGAESDFSTKGYTGGLKMVFSAASYRRLDAAMKAEHGGSATALAATNEEAKPYADHYFEYYPDGHTNEYKVQTEVAQGAGCSACTGGMGTYSFTYVKNSYHGSDWNTWKVKTVESLPDNTPSDANDNDRNIVYTNIKGNVVLKVFRDTEAAVAVSTITQDGTTANVTTSAAHGYSSGDTVVITGASPAEYNGEFVILTVGTDTFSYAMSDDPGDDATGTSIKSTRFTDHRTHYRYNDKGQVILVTHPSAAVGTLVEIDHDGQGRDLMGWDEFTGDFEHISDTSGLVELYKYHGDEQNDETTATDSAAGDVLNYLKRISIQRGDGGGNPSPIVLREMNYIARTSTIDSDPVTTIYKLASETAYEDGNLSGDRRTNYRYTWYGDDTASDPSDDFQVRSITVEEEVVSTGRNGAGGTSGTPTAAGDGDKTITFFDPYGRPTWMMEAAQEDSSIWTGHITYLEYDRATGGLIKHIRDVNTEEDSDFVALPDGWENAAGLHLVREMAVDNLGRTTMIRVPVDSNPNNDRITHFVYDDIHEGGINHANDDGKSVRMYRGWVGGMINQTTSPVEVLRWDELIRNVGGTDHAFSYTESMLLSTTGPLPVDGNGAPDGSESLSSLNLQSLRREYVNRGGQLTDVDRYVHFNGTTYAPDSEFGAGTGAAPNRYRTSHKYDDRGNLETTVAPTGTITKHIHDGLRRITEKQVGRLVGSTETNVRVVEVYEYDGGGVGDGNLTKITRDPNPTQSSDERVTEMFYDWRNRLVVTKAGVEGTESESTNRQLWYYEYNNLAEVMSEERYDGDTVTITTTDGVPQKPAVARRVYKLDHTYDEQGRMARHKQYANPSSSIDTSGLVTDLWYDERDNVIKEKQPGGLVMKHQYDGADRLAKSFQSDGGSDTTWAHAKDVINDNVLTQTEYQYDPSDNLLLSTTRERFHNETATGALQDNSTTPNARVSYLAYFYDLASRMTSQANLGTNAGSAWSVGQSVPSAALVTTYSYSADEVQTITLTGNPSDTYDLTFKGYTAFDMELDYTAANLQSELESLPSIGVGNVDVVSPNLEGGPYSITFKGALGAQDQPQLTSTPVSGGEVRIETAVDGQAGRLADTTDPRGIVKSTSTDALGRTTRVVEAFTDGIPTASDNRRTEYGYDGNNNVLTMTARLPDGLFQTTEYVYAMPSGISGSPIDSNDLLWEVKYPDLTTGAPSSTDKEIFRYNALGQRISFEDRIQPTRTKHEYGYDVMGRLTKDAVATLGTGVNGNVRRLEYTYDSAGRPEKFTSYSAASGGSVVNEVKREYNGLGQLTKEFQEHSGEVGALSPVVKYEYSAVDSNNRSRLTKMTFPAVDFATDPRAVHYRYGSGLDSSISRVAELASAATGGTVYEAYSYLGLDTIVKAAHPENGVDLTYDSGNDTIVGEAGDRYVGLDRFDRVVEQKWASFSTVTEHFKYGYDRHGNRLWRDNVLTDSLSGALDLDELYHADGAAPADAYDNLDRLVEFQRGKITLDGNGNRQVTSAARSQEWDLDPLGNWDSITNDGGSPESRTHNQQNQITSGNLTYDGNGNLTGKDPTARPGGEGMSYDAWNRLTSHTKLAQSVLSDAITTYRYDALGRRIQEGPTTLSGSVSGQEPYTELYYSANWQVIMEVQQTWVIGGGGGGSGFEDELEGSGMFVGRAIHYIWSQRYIDALVLRDRDTNLDGTLNERLYVQQDANFNVTAVVNTSGAVQERFVYDPYGVATVLDANWDSTTDTFDWRYRHQGLRYEPVSKTYDNRMRPAYDPHLGRFWSQDSHPIPYVDGMNRYQYIRSNPVRFIDPTGREAATVAAGVVIAGGAVGGGATTTGGAVIAGGSVVGGTTIGGTIAVTGTGVISGSTVIGATTVTGGGAAAGGAAVGGAVAGAAIVGTAAAGFGIGYLIGKLIDDPIAELIYPDPNYGPLIVLPAEPVCITEECILWDSERIHPDLYICTYYCPTLGFQIWFQEGGMPCDETMFFEE